MKPKTVSVSLLALMVSNFLPYQFALAEGQSVAQPDGPKSISLITAKDPAKDASTDSLKQAARNSSKNISNHRSENQVVSKAVLDDLKKTANDGFYADDCSKARQAIEKLIELSNCNLKHLDHECLEFYMNLAVLDIQEDQVKQARAILNRLLEVARTEDAKNNNGGMDEPDCLYFLAECDYREGSYGKAEKLYREALAQYRKVINPLSIDLSAPLQGLAGCLARRGANEEAVELFTEIARIDIKNFGPDSLKTAWSLLNLSDALRRVHRNEEAKQLFEKSVYTFRQVNFDRLAKFYPTEEANAQANAEVLAHLRPLCFGLGDRDDYKSGGKMFQSLSADLDKLEAPSKRPNDFYNWRLKAAQIVDAPGLVTMNPNKPLLGLIICVHGLGLHHGTYNDFARALAEKGYGTVAFDVRGFGSYKDDRGHDHVDLHDSVKDLGGILALMRRDYPNQSIFLLGESMGGAIALHVASLYSKLIDGLVSSVPSGNRFGAASTDAKVAFHLLSSKNKPFNIGTRIVSQATQKETLRKQWKTDPEARMKLSAVELIQFQKFMNQNLDSAKKLTKLPVIIFQGYGDKLVRPDGTLALYNAIASEDKDLVFVGHSEHLIFEEGQFKPAAVNGLEGWLRAHRRTD